MSWWSDPEWFSRQRKSLAINNEALLVADLKKKQHTENHSGPCVLPCRGNFAFARLCNADAECWRCNGSKGKKRSESTKADGGVGGVAGSAVEIL